MLSVSACMLLPAAGAIRHHSANCSCSSFDPSESAVIALCVEWKHTGDSLCEMELCTLEINCSKILRTKPVVLIHKWRSYVYMQHAYSQRCISVQISVCTSSLVRNTVLLKESPAVAGQNMGKVLLKKNLKVLCFSSREVYVLEITLFLLPSSIPLLRSCRVFDCCDTKALLRSKCIECASVFPIVAMTTRVLI